MKLWSTVALLGHAVGVLASQPYNVIVKRQVELPTQLDFEWLNTYDIEGSVESDWLSLCYSAWEGSYPHEEQAFYTQFYPADEREIDVDDPSKQNDYFPILSYSATSQENGAFEDSCYVTVPQGGISYMLYELPRETVNAQGINEFQADLKLRKFENQRLQPRAVSLEVQVDTRGGMWAEGQFSESLKDQYTLKRQWSGDYTLSWVTTHVLAWEPFNETLEINVATLTVPFQPIKSFNTLRKTVYDGYLIEDANHPVTITNEAGQAVTLLNFHEENLNSEGYAIQDEAYFSRFLFSASGTVTKEIRHPLNPDHLVTGFERYSDTELLYAYTTEPVHEAIGLIHNQLKIDRVTFTGEKNHVFTFSSDWEDQRLLFNAPGLLVLQGNHTFVHNESLQKGDVIVSTVVHDDTYSQTAGFYFQVLRDLKPYGEGNFFTNLPDEAFEIHDYYGTNSPFVARYKFVETKNSLTFSLFREKGAGEFKSIELFNLEFNLFPQGIMPPTPPTPLPTEMPTVAPTPMPTRSPTSQPTPWPTRAPTTMTSTEATTTQTTTETITQTTQASTSAQRAATLMSTFTSLYSTTHETRSTLSKGRSNDLTAETHQQSQGKLLVALITLGSMGAVYCFCLCSAALKQKHRFSQMRSRYFHGEDQANDISLVAVDSLLEEGEGLGIDEGVGMIPAPYAAAQNNAGS